MLSKFSVKRPFTVLVAVIIVLVFGVISYIKMTPDLFPNINTPYVIVMTTYPGASPEEVESQITDSMEQQLATLTNIKEVTSISADNYSVVQLEFSDDVNMDSISVDIREKIDQIEGDFPDSVGTPVVMKISMDMMPVVTAAVGMEGKNSTEVSNFTRENLETALQGVEGVASVTSMGMVDDGIQIVLSQDKIDDINEKISSAISSQMGSAKSQITSGISSAKSGKSKISSGKNAISSAQSDSTTQIEAAKAKLTQSKEELQELKSQGSTLKQLLNQYNSATNSVVKAQIEAQIKAAGYSDVSELESAVAQLDTIDAQIKAIDEAISNLNVQESTSSFTLGSKYSDLSATESTLESTINQLQSALSELESSEDAALASADMSGVLTMSNVAAILNAQNFSMPAGYVTDGKADILVSVGDKIKDEDELKDLVLFDMGIDGVDPIKLSDIATITSSSESSDTYAKINGNNGVLLSFTKQSSYATAEVSENIQDKFDELEEKYDGLNFTSLYDQGEYIRIVINSVLQNLFLGAILAILILLFFLRDIRPTIITAVSIPLSVIFAIVLMYFSGVTLNMISLAGLAIGVGMLVDNSIVVVENIYRLRSLGYSKLQSAVSGAVQVAGAITTSTLTTICVFVPIVFVEGMTKDIFIDLALTVSYSLVASLLIALTVVPAMAKSMLTKEGAKTVLSQHGRVVTRYKRIVAWGLCHKKVVIIGAIVLLVGSSAAALVRGFEFMPSMSTNQISATLQMPDDSTLEETAATTDKLVDEISEVDGVETIGSMLSSDTMAMMGMSSAEQDTTSTMIYIVLDDDKVSMSHTIAKRMEKFAKKNNCEITTSADMDMTSLIGGSGVSINLYSDDLDLLRETGSAIEDKLGEMESLEEISDVDEDSTKELKVVVNKNAAMEKGLTVAEVYQQVYGKLSKEQSATTLVQTDGDIDVTVENTNSGELKRSDLEKMKLTVTDKDGNSSKVALTSIAEIQEDASLSTINHDNQKRYLSITADVKDDYNVTKVTSEVKKMINEEELVPAGVDIEYSGENEEIMDAMEQMLLMLAVGAILVYLIMVAQFQSLRSPFIIIFTIPLAFTGGMLALLITGEVVSVVSMMGLVMLMGIVVNNAIVLVDCINRFRLEGMDMDEAIISAGAVRIRPVIMTALTTILGLIPLAIGIGTGAEMMQPVAVVCIGGLLYATLTTLVVIPVMYKIFAKKHMEKIKEEDLEIIHV